MRLSSNEVESRNHCTQLILKPPPLTLSCGSVPGRKEDHLNRSMKMKAKMVKTKGCGNKDVKFGTKYCKKYCDIFFLSFQQNVFFFFGCLSLWGFSC